MSGSVVSRQKRGWAQISENSKNLAGKNLLPSAPPPVSVKVPIMSSSASYPSYVTPSLFDTITLSTALKVPNISSSASYPSYVTPSLFDTITLSITLSTALKVPNMSSSASYPSYVTPSSILLHCPQPYFRWC